MAKIVSEPKEIIATKTIKEGNYTIELDEEEFAVLAVLVGNISGGKGELTKNVFRLWNGVFEKYYIQTYLNNTDLENSLYSKFNKLYLGYDT